MLPYQPTILLSPNSSLIYVLDASNAASPSLYSLDTSSHLDASNLQSATSAKTDLTSISNNGAKALLPVLNQEGRVTLLAGTCGLSGNQVALYTLNGGNPTYTSVQSSGQGPAPYLGYLSAAWTFGANIYTFGGMCPNSTGLTAANWQASASYSASLNELQSSSSDASAMVFGSVSGSMPLVPEAGFSVTALDPQLSKASGSGITQDFMWIGGQTQTAFINMSALAVYSLPGNTWSAISVANPSNASAPEPRSGHTATLSSDGSSIVVVGGWVGDINTPAQPQVAILQRTSGSGTASQWQWVVPLNSSSIPSSIMQNGIYGHGATMLNGDTLMLVGGQSTASSSKRKRQASSANVQFYNYAQNEWATTYSNPGTATSSPTSVSSGVSSASATSMVSSMASSAAASITSSAMSAPTSTETSSTNNDTSTGLSAGQKAGIAIGVILGIAALLLLVSYLNIKFLKRSKQREPSEKDAAALPWSKYDKNDRSNFSVLPNSMRPASLHSNDYPWAPVMGEDWDEKSALPSVPAHKEINNAARTGVLVEIPSPTRGLRKGAHARNSQYYPTWRDDTTRPGPIHRIDEAREEEEQEEQDPFKSPVSNQRRSFLSAPQLDNPFLDPLGSHPVLSPRPHSPTTPLARSHEMEGWMSDWAKADAILQGNHGRVSPTKSDRPTSYQSGASAKTDTTSSTEGRALAKSAAKRGISGRGLRRKPLPQFQVVNQPTEPVKRIMGPGRPLPAKPTATVRPTLNHLQVPQTEYLGAGVEAGNIPPRSPSHVQRVRTWMDSMRSVLGSTRAVAPPPPIVALPQPETSSPRRAVTAIPWQPRKGARDWDVDITDAAQQHQPLYKHDDDDDWDVEGAVQNRVVQMMFTAPRDKIRVVNAHEGDSVSLSSAGGGEELERDHEEQKEVVETAQYLPLRGNMI